jgi:hypothetical protein
MIVSVVPAVAALAHGAIGSEDHVSMTLPPELSARLGEYVVLCDVALPNEPVPLVDHMPEGELVELAEIATGPSPSHVV